MIEKAQTKAPLGTQPFWLEGEKVLLRAPKVGDVETLFAAGDDSEILRWTSIPLPRSVEGARAFVTEGVPATWEKGGCEWAICLPDDTEDKPKGEGGKAIGMMALRKVETGLYEVGFWMGRAWRGHGYMDEALSLALDCAFERFGAHCVLWRAFEGNWASRKIAWKHGFSNFHDIVGMTSPERVARVQILGEQPQLSDEELLAQIAKRAGSLGAGNMWEATLRAGDRRQPQGQWEGPELGENGEVKRPAMPSSLDPEALVRQFHQVYGLPVVCSGPNIDNERMHMRMSLILEECQELVRAFYGATAGEQLEQALAALRGADEGERDLVEVADALADLVYVIYGMALEAGISLPHVLAEVQASNLSKLGADGRPIYREDGKVLKGPGFFPPNVERALGHHIVQKDADSGKIV